MKVSSKLNVETLFDSIKDYSNLVDFVNDGECEGQYIECKSPFSLQGLDKKLESELSEEISGFSNSGGGVIIFGMATDNKKGFDVMTQPEPIGSVNQFMKKLTLKIPFLTQPTSRSIVKVIKEKDEDTKGFVVMYVPLTLNDPVKSNKDGKFYIRTGNETPEMPYETLKKMFLGSTSPDLISKLERPKLNKVESTWKISIKIDNLSTYPSKNTKVSIKLINYKNTCESVVTSSFKDASSVNDGEKIFFSNPKEYIYKGLSLIIGEFAIKMKKGIRLLLINTTIYAENMRPRVQTYKIYLNKTKEVKFMEIYNDYLY